MSNGAETNTAMDWLMDYDDALAGDLGLWWQRRAEQHTEEFLHGEKPATWRAWRDVRQRESAPLAPVPAGVVVPETPQP